MLYIPENRLRSWALASLPNTKQAVESASAVVASGAITVALRVPSIGNPVLGFIMWQYFLPSISK